MATNDMLAGADVFISYAREELEFVREIDARLEQNGLGAWYDVKALRAGERFWDEIRKAIDAATALVFVISPDSVRSPHCQQEVQYAADQQKRIVPVLRRDIGDTAIPIAISAIQWVLFQSNTEEAMAALEKAIRADWDWLSTHAWLLRRGGEWEAQSRDSSRLLRGRDLLKAEGWLQSTHAGKERPIPLQIEFIGASRRGTTRRRIIVATSVAIAAVTSVLAGAVAINKAMTATINEVTDWNSKAREAFAATEDADSMRHAREVAERAIDACRSLYFRNSECDAALINLAIAKRGLNDLEGSLKALTELIDRFAHIPPQTDDDSMNLAAARWERTVTGIAFAEAAGNESERTKRYALPSTDMSEAQKIFDRLPERSKGLPVAITKARLLLVNGDYDRAKNELDSILEDTPEKLLLQALTYHCLGMSALASDTLGRYNVALPGGTDSLQARRELPFLTRNMTCVPLAR